MLFRSGYRTIEVPVQEGGVQRLTLKPGIPVECPAVGNDKTIWSEESDAARRRAALQSGVGSGK